MLTDATAVVVDGPSFLDRYDPSSVPPLTAEGLAGRFLMEYTNEATRRAYRANLRYFFEWCLDNQLDPLQAKREHIAAYMNCLIEDRLAPATTCGKLGTLKSFYKWCIDEEQLVRNPVSSVRRPQIPSDTSREWLTGFELARCIQVAEAEGGYTYPLICLLAMNALRIGAVINARIEDLQQDRHHTTLKVRTKNSQVYTTALPTRRRCGR